MVELKLVEKLFPFHKKQLLAYLKIAGIKLDEPVKSRKQHFLSFRRPYCHFRLSACGAQAGESRSPFFSIGYKVSGLLPDSIRDLPE
ncbi:MAG: hypothetical protein U9R17_19045 [Thermodesulfobacteriota bacterium]|nr:hypothetical protein [Thermodesulfobacteriota bacterium]